MGIDVDHSLLVGASYQELENFFEKIIELGETDKHEACTGYQEVIDCYFNYASPYYDSDPEDWFLGFRIPNFQEINQEWWDIVKETAHQFELLTGVKAQIRGGAHVW